MVWYGVRVKSMMHVCVHVCTRLSSASDTHNNRPGNNKPNRDARQPTKPSTVQTSNTQGADGTSAAVCTVHRHTYSPTEGCEEEEGTRHYEHLACPPKTLGTHWIHASMHAQCCVDTRS